MPVTVLHNFTSGAAGDGSNPASLIQGQNGDFYGVTTSGAANGFGTVFQLDPGGNLTSLYVATSANLSPPG